MRCCSIQRGLVCLLALATFCALLGRKDIVTSHEARVAQTARIMAASGWPWSAAPVSVPVMHMTEIDGIKQLRADNSRGQMQVNPWLVPVINNQLRLQKPPLPYWCDAIVFRLCGFGEWQARIVPGLLGAIATLLIWDVARMLLGQRAGFIAAGVWLSTHFIVDEYRKSMADPYLAFCTLACVWTWMRPAPRLALFYLFLALGALSKGPVIFITVLIALIAFHASRRRLPGRLPMHLLGFLLLLSISLPWCLYIFRHVPNALDIWRYESVGELTGENIEKVRPWWMYIGNSFQLPLPWTPLWIAGIVLFFLHGRRGLSSRRGRRRRVAILWQVLTVFFFSLSGVKKQAYLLPAMPAQTLIITDALLLLLAFARRTRFGGMPAVLALMQAMIGIGFSGGLALWLLRGNVHRSTAILCGILAMAAALVVLIPILRKCPRIWFKAQVLAYAIILVVLLGVQQPNTENRRSSRAFAGALTQYLHDSNLPLMVHSMPEDLAIYLPLNLPDADDLPHALLAVDHSPKDPPETLESLSRTIGDAKVIDASPVQLKGVDPTGRWRLFEVTILRPETRI